MAEAQGRRASRQVLLASFWLTLLFFGVKVWVGWTTRSLSLVSESLHTLIHSFSLFLSLISVSSLSTSSSQTAHREVWGHSKLEFTLASLLTAFLGFVCLTLLAASTQQLEVISQSAHLNSQANAHILSVRISLPLLQSLGVVLATNLCLACFERYEAGVLQSSILRFNANHSFQDAWLMIVVLLGLSGVWYGYTWLDPLLAIGIVLFSTASYWRVLNWQLPSLIKQIAIAPEALAQTIHQVEGITHCYKIESRGMVGRHVVVEMRLILHPECVGIAHTIAERVERVIRERYGPVRVIIYIDNDHSKHKRLAKVARR